MRLGEADDDDDDHDDDDDDDENMNPVSRPVPFLPRREIP